VLDPSWSSSGLLSIQNLQALTLTGGMFLNFNLFAPTFAVVRIENAVTTAASSIFISGNTVGTTIAIIDGIFGFGNEQSIQVQNCYGGVTNSTVDDLTINHTANGTGSNFTLSSVEVLGNTLIEDNTTSGLRVFCMGDKYIGTVTFHNFSSGNLNVNSVADSYFNTLTLTGPLTFLTTDVLGVTPLLLGGATSAQVTINARKALSGGTGISYDPVTGVITNTSPGINTDASYGEMYFTGNVTPTVIGSIGVPVKVNSVYSAGDLLHFTQDPSGTLTCTNPNAIEYAITVCASGTMTLATDTIQMSIYLNGAIVSKSIMKYSLDGISPSFRPVPLQCGLTLVATDTVEIFIANLTSTDNPTVDSLNCFVSSIGGSNLVGGATLQSAYDAGNGIIVETPAKPFVLQSNLTTTIPASLTYQTDISNLGNPIGLESTFAVNTLDVAINYRHMEVFALNATAGAESALVNFNAYSQGADVIFASYNGLTKTTKFIATETQASGHLSVGPSISGVNFTLGTTLLYTASYPNGVFTSVWNTLHGTNVVLANSLGIGQTVEIDITGQMASSGSGGTGILQFAFGTFAVQSNIINFSGFSGQKNMAVKIKVTRVDSTNVTCSVAGWYADTANNLRAFQMIISPALLPYNASLNTALILEWGPTFTAGNGFNFLAKNLNIIQYS
jgi:hypothetical protein